MPCVLLKISLRLKMNKTQLNFRSTEDKVKKLLSRFIFLRPPKSFGAHAFVPEKSKKWLNFPSLRGRPNRRTGGGTREARKKNGVAFFPASLGKNQLKFSVIYLPDWFDRVACWITGDDVWSESSQHAPAHQSFSSLFAIFTVNFLWLFSSRRQTTWLWTTQKLKNK